MKADASALTIMRPTSFDDVAVGSSIAVSGVCLTVVACDDGMMTFDLAETTKKRTVLGAIKEGSTVNLERAMKANGRFEGHVVQGHVDGVARVVSVKTEGEGRSLSVRIPDDLRHLVVPRGSIALDGVSLTVAAYEGDEATVALIPHTLSMTTLGSVKEGSLLNVETDLIGRYVHASASARM